MEFGADGSGQPQAAEPGNPASPPAGDANGGSSEGGQGLLSVLNEGNRELATKKGWTEATQINDILDGYRGLEGKLGTALTPPGKDATPDDITSFYNKASESWGKVNAETHKFDMPEGLPENMPYDADFAKQAASWMADAGVPSHVAQSLHDNFVKHQANVFTQMEQHAADAQKAQEDAAAAAHRELTKTFGPADSDAYKIATVKAQRAMDNMGLRDWATEKGILSKPDAQGNQAVLDPVMIESFVKVFDGMMKEDGVTMSQATGRNPFAKDTLSLSDQAALIKNNPDMARQMMQAAGKDPKKFGL